MDKKTIFGFNIIVLIVSVIQIIAGGMAIKLGSDISNTKDSKLYSAVYTPEANFYIAAGVISLLLCGYSIFVGLYNSINPTMTNSVFFSTLTVLSFQFAMAVYSSIAANVMSDSSSNFSDFPKNQCSCVTVNNIFTAVAIITWLLSVPVNLIELNGRWEDCKKLVIEQQQPSIEAPEVNVSNNIRDSLR